MLWLFELIDARGAVVARLKFDGTVSEAVVKERELALHQVPKRTLPAADYASVRCLQIDQGSQTDARWFDSAAFEGILEYYADGRPLCECRLAYHRVIPAGAQGQRKWGCEYGCEINRMRARNEIAERATREFKIVQSLVRIW